ncbi:MAG: Calx-beta domain-containing protein [Bacteroidota bacterium]
MKRIFTVIALLLTTTIAFAQNPAPCSDLFFSEYVEGTSFNKVIEIYNPTGSTIDLANYKLLLFANGSPTPTSTFSMFGSIAAGAVYIVTNPNDTSVYINSIADTTAGTVNFTGNDAFALLNLTSTDTIDRIGQFGNDPGANGWTVGSGSTSDHTLVRMSTIHNGQSDWSIGATEWDVYPINDFTHLGAHTFSPCVVNPEVYLISTAQSVIESGVSISIEVGIINPNASATTVILTASDISATTGSDYSLTGNPVTVTFPANSSANQTVTISIMDDLTVEPTETFSVALSNATNGATLGTSQEIVTITDDDTPPQVYLVNATQTVGEAGVSVVLQVGINNPNTNTTSVTLTLSDIGATELQDYFLSGNPITVSFPGGTSANQTVTVSIIDDVINELDETFKATLSNPTNGASIGTSEELITITDNDPLINSYISFWVNDDSVSESMPVFSSQLEIFSGNPTTSPTTIDVTVLSSSSTATEGTDFSFNDTTISWPAGDATSKYAVFHIIDDNNIEPMEHFVLTLSNPTNNSAIGNVGNTLVNIIDNDPNSIQSILGDKNSLLIPNPANDKVILITNGQYDFYEIRDAAGRIIAATNIHAQTASTIMLNNFAAGIYFVYLHNSEGAEVMKLMKQ